MAALVFIVHGQNAADLGNALGYTRVPSGSSSSRQKATASSQLHPDGNKQCPSESILVCGTCQESPVDEFTTDMRVAKHEMSILSADSAQ